MRPVAFRMCPMLVHDGRRVVTYRRADPEDGSRILDLYASLSPESSYQRFHQATPRITPTLGRALTNIECGAVWLAMNDGHCVGEARLCASRLDAVWHLAVTVADRVQRSGIGTHLLERIVADPRRPIGPITASILASNTAAIGLARRFGSCLTLSHGIYEAEFCADGHNRTSRDRG